MLLVKYNPFTVPKPFGLWATEREQYKERCYNRSLLYVPLHAYLTGLSQQQMDTKESEVKISNSQCFVHGTCPGASALHHGKT